MLDPRASSTIVGIVRGHVGQRPDATAFVYLPDGLVEAAQVLSFTELDARATRLAAQLRERWSAGDRALMLFPPGVDFVVGYLGVLYAGMVAVPAPLPGGSGGSEWKRTALIAQDCTASVVLTSSPHAEEVRDRLGEHAAHDTTVLAVDEVASAESVSNPAWAPPTLEPTDIAVLQYTSGSTGDPKGVVVTHANVLANVLAHLKGFGLGPKDVLGGWLPMFHDMGLFATLTPALVLGVPCVTTSPTTFVKRPRRWLEMIDHFGITYSAAPNFAYELCVRRVENLDGLDLSRWRRAVNGSEPVRATTLRSFAEHFAATGFRSEALSPSYGLAEATVFVSTSAGLRSIWVDADALAQNQIRVTEDGHRRELVGCGPMDSFDWLVVEPEGRDPVAAGAVGELLLRGPSVCGGYWEAEEATREIFEVHATPQGGPWMRTGDLAVVHDGELFITGRLKETLIFNGRNIYPQDVEHELRNHHPELGDRGAVFSVTTDEAPEALVVTHEIGKGQDGDPAKLAAAMRRTLLREFGLETRGIVLLPPNSVLRTTSGKIRRGGMREQFRRGGLRTVYADAGAQALTTSPADDEHPV